MMIIGFLTSAVRGKGDLDWVNSTWKDSEFREIMFRHTSGLVCGGQTLPPTPKHTYRMHRFEE